jgi:hypothetical protein
MSTLFFVSISVFAQEKNDMMDIIKTIKTEEAKFLQDGVYVDKVINIVETRKQLVDTKPNQSDLLNQERLPAPINVTKTIRLDHNSDEAYDLTTKVTYQIVDGVIKNLNVEYLNKSSEVDQEVLMLDGMKREGYVMGTEDTAVFGYINAENEFVVDYF